MKPTQRSKLVMIGDSVTDAGRTLPVGEGLFNALGGGYPALVNALLGTFYPQLGIRVVNMGSSGHTVRELRDRWQTDVVDLKPDWVSVMIGVNDVWRQFDSPFQPETHVPAEEYEAILDTLVARTVPLTQGVVLMCPYFIEPNRSDAMRAQMDRYGTIVRNIAGNHGAIFVDTQAAFDDMTKYYHPTMLAWDRIHPGQPGPHSLLGHMVIARAFLDAVGFEWPQS